MGTAQSQSDKRFYVYGYVRHSDSLNGPKGSFYYIGKGHGKRSHHRATHTVKLPSDKSNIVIIEHGMSESDALQAEMLLIFLYGRIDCGRGCLRNKTDGGDGITGYVYTEEHRAKLRGNKRGQANKGMKRSEEFCRMMAETKRGKRLRPHSEFSRQKTSQSLMGHKVSEQTREKQRLAKLGRKQSEAAILKKIGRVASEQTRLRMSESQKLRRAKRKEQQDGKSKGIGSLVSVSPADA